MLLGNWQQKKSKQKLSINSLNFHKLHKIFINTLVINLGNKYFSWLYGTFSSETADKLVT